MKNIAENSIIISLEKVCKTFGSGETEVHALKDITLDVYQGEFLVIVGESGCGKSTLLNIIGGLEAPTAGDFCFDGENYSRAKEKVLTLYRRNTVGYVFQAYNLMPTLTAKENLDFIGELCENPLDSDIALESVGLGQKRNSYPAQLSGGQQQRISIARALVKQPRIILADEPTAALDYHTSLDVLELFKEVTKNGTTILMVTHNQEIAKMADRIIHLKDGEIDTVEINDNPLSAKELVW